MTLQKITLLSTEEYEKYKPTIPLIEDNWWLRTHGFVSNLAGYVHRNGRISCFGYNVADYDTGVRPALNFNLDPSDNLFWYKPEKLIGTKIEYGNWQWTVLYASFGKLYALCDNVVAHRRFDPNSNDWNASELKRWLETDLTQALNQWFGADVMKVM